MVVGYVRYTVRDLVLLEEFEIFREYRGRGHGLIFVRALLEYKGYGGKPVVCRVEPVNIDGSEAFWIRVLGTEHFAISIEHHCRLDDDTDHRSELDALCDSRRYSARMRAYCHAILDALMLVDNRTATFFHTHPDTEYYDYMADVHRMVEVSAAWHAIHRKK